MLSSCFLSILTFLLLSTTSTFILQAGSVIVLPLSRVSRSSLDPIPLSNEASPVNVTDIRDYAYLADISIGGQTLPIIVDTGSYDLWVVSSTCSTKDCSTIIKYSNTSTLQETNTPFHINYLTGSVSGNIAFESISVGNYLVSEQLFALANNPENLGLSAIGNSGIMGLAFPRVAAISLKYGQNLISNVLDYLDAESRFFGVVLGRNAQGSTLTIGGHDNATLSNVSSITSFDVYSSNGNVYDYWKISLDALLFGSEYSPIRFSKSKVPTSPRPIAVFDTGTTLILGPSDDVRQFWFEVGGARQGEDGTWQVRCELAIEMAFVFGNVTVYIDPSDLSWSAQKSPDGWCDGGVQANDNVIGGDWLLGDTFLRNVYVAHYVSIQGRPPKLGLLPLTNPNSSLDAFKNTRGFLSEIPATISASSPSGGKGLKEPLWLQILAPILGFCFGSMCVALWKVWSSRRVRRRKGSDLLDQEEREGLREKIFSGEIK